ncbi:hypothetical protein [Shinella kummerowiae]|uniref:hypothetical protein n=1 Tax=Shinella kummerowiae TaxID=417745 RepID=UPI0021B4F0B6|nr:hypothetical protein [Shinella kummerowiae]MCT7663852.1 hypothetical protein [Shinella kummerowiae]
MHSNLLGLNVSAGDGEVAQLTCYFLDYGVARLLGAIAGLLLVSLMRAAPPPPPGARRNAHQSHARYRPGLN